MYVERSLKPLFNKVSSIYSMVAVLGARQAGKTTFLQEQAKARKVSYVLFDDPDARGLFDADIKKFATQYLSGHELSVLDEVQYCKEPGPKLKYLADTGHKLWITSSSEVLTSRDILSYLVGRVSLMRLFPFNLKEFLAAKGVKAHTPDILRRMVWEHMSYGGYPRVVTTEDTELKRVILGDLYETMLLKDVTRNFAIDDMAGFEALVRYLAVIPGTLLSYRKVSNALNISFPTLKKYLNALEQSYLIVQVRPFFTNKQKELVKQPRIYFLDTGMCNQIAGQFPVEPSGRHFENYVLTELLKMGFTPKYWRTKAKAEVDFIIKPEQSPLPIEVKLQASPDRISRSLRSFIRAYQPEQAYIVTYKGETGELKVNGCRVHIVDPEGLWEGLGGI